MNFEHEITIICHDATDALRVTEAIEETPAMDVQLAQLNDFDLSIDIEGPLPTSDIRSKYYDRARDIIEALKTASAVTICLWRNERLICSDSLNQ